MNKDTVIENLRKYPEVKSGETANAFAILQCRHESEKLFLSYEWIKGQVNLSDYNYIKDYPLCDYARNEPVGKILNWLFESFNVDKPVDFHGHSMSVSDIIAILTADGVKFYFVDSIGFKLLDL